MYPINPFQPVSDVIRELASMAALEGGRDAAMALGRSMVAAVREGQTDAVLRLALAHCVWREARIDHAVMADMVEVMLAARHAQDSS